LCYTDTKVRGGNEKKRKIFLLKNGRGQRFCVLLGDWKPSGTACTHTHTHTYAHSISLVMLLPSPSLYKLRISCGRTKAKRHQIFFFSFPSFCYTRPVNNPFTILFRLSLSLRSIVYLRGHCCVCVFIGSFYHSVPRKVFRCDWRIFLFSSLHSRCVSLLDLSISLIIIKLHFASIYALDNWNFIFFLFLISPFLPLFEADTISPSNAFSRQKRSRPRCDAAGSHSRVLY
jgi:hypothetical protein